MSDKITIRYTTSDNRIIVLSESDPTPDRPIKLSNLEKIKLTIECATFLAIIATFSIYVVLAILQYRANKIYGEALETSKEANRINQQSLDANRKGIEANLKALMESHAPWIKIREVALSEEKIPPAPVGSISIKGVYHLMGIAFVFENISDALAFDSRATWSAEWNDGFEKPLGKLGHFRSGSSNSSRNDWLFHCGVPPVRGRASSCC